MNEFLIWVSSFCIFVLLAAMYCLYRNDKVYEFRMGLIGDPAFELLPSYDTMMYKFWVWPLGRFLLQKHRRKEARVPE